jgi:hemolysin D
VLNQDIGFIKLDQEAKIKIDTFTFQKYGFIKANIEYISKDAIEDENLGLIYEVVVKPKQNFLDTSSGKVYLQSGMSVTTEIKVGKRKVIEFFIYPIVRYLDEGLSVR